MSAPDAPKPTRRGMPALVGVVLLLCPFGYSAVSALVTGGEPEPFLAPPEHAEQGCIRPIEYMRFRHMDLLTEMRDAGVRHGARREVTFTDCTRCHTTRAGFCDRCHESVNLEPDCFECHYYP